MYHRGDYVMARLKKFIKRYRFFLLLVLINGLLFIIEPELGQETAALSVHNLLEMLSVIPPIFLLLGLMDVWVPRETMMKYMGKDAGIKGGIFAFVLGSFSEQEQYKVLREEPLILDYAYLQELSNAYQSKREFMSLCPFQVLFYL